LLGRPWDYSLLLPPQTLARGAVVPQARPPAGLVEGSHGQHLRNGRWLPSSASSCCVLRSLSVCTAPFVRFPSTHFTYRSRSPDRNYFVHGRRRHCWTGSILVTEHTKLRQLNPIHNAGGGLNNSENNPSIHGKGREGNDGIWIEAAAASRSSLP